MKIVDIVKLELCGALLGTRLHVFLQDEMRYKFCKVHHIVDSEIVKAMVMKASYGFNTFAANRIGEIQLHTAKDEWSCVASKLNIADMTTHWGKASAIDIKGVWQNGPEFLKQPEELWPISAVTNIDALPETLNRVHNVISDETESLDDRIDIDRFSKLSRLLNTTARVLNLYKRFKTGSNKDERNITADDVKYAEWFWIKEASSECLTAS